MSAITHIAAGENAPEVVRSRFRAAARSRVAPEVLARHSRIALLAFQVFEDRATALHFLNTHDRELGGRPIDLAGASDTELGSVVAALSGIRSRKHSV